VPQTLEVSLTNIRNDADMWPRDLGEERDNPPREMHPFPGPRNGARHSTGLGVSGDLTGY